MLDKEKMTVRELDLFERLEANEAQKFECPNCGWPVPVMLRNQKGHLNQCFHCSKMVDNPYYSHDRGKGNTPPPRTPSKTKIQRFIFPDCFLFRAECRCGRMLDGIITPDNDQRISKCVCGMYYSARMLYGQPKRVDVTDGEVLYHTFKSYAKVVETEAV